MTCMTDIKILIIGKSDYIENAALLLSEGYTLVRAETGGRAAELCRKFRPDLAVADTTLADIKSTAMLARLRGCCGEDFPVLFISDKPAEECSVLSAGARDFVAAPINEQVLLCRVKNIASEIRTEKSLEEHYSHDSETGLLAHKAVSQQMEEICRSSDGVLMLVSPDDLSLVDEIYGDGMKTRLLGYFGIKLREIFSQNEIVGRLESGEIVICSETRKSIHSINSLTIMLNHLLSEGLEALTGEDIEPVAGASVGAVFFPDEGTDANNLLGKARKALDSLREHEKRGYAVYDSSFPGGIMKDKAVNDDIDSLERRLRESDVPHGAFRIGFDALGQVYHYFMRYIDRYCESAFKVLFTLTPVDPDYGSVYELAEYFGELIGRQLRRSDILVHTKQNQFFMILPDVSRENFEMLMERILKPWYSSDYADVIDLDYESKQVTERKPVGRTFG
ncbi:MAG: diguanylate cyclase [Ruminococcus sp.]|nr:diguanylate cyclase [Ruminococcus sp.]